MDSIYGQGGFESREERNEGFADISPNRTLMAEQLTGEAPMIPEIATGLQTLQQVFAHYAPTATVTFEEEDGLTRTETFRFNAINDFVPENLVAASSFLRRKTIQKEECYHIISELRNNGSLRTVLSGASDRKALLDAIRSMMAALQPQPSLT